MSTQNKETRRVSGVRSEIRKSAKGRMAVGYSIVFPPAVSDDLGGFVEEIASSAVNLSTAGNVWALRAHDDSKQLASTHAGTLRLFKDAKGIRHEIDLPNTTDGDDLAELIGRGDGGQCSFGFIANADAWQNRADGSVLRTVTDLRLLEISIGVVFPAYSDTTLALRNAPAAIKAALKRASNGHGSGFADDDPKRLPDGTPACNCRCVRCVEGRCERCIGDDNLDCVDEQCAMRDCPQQGLSKHDKALKAAALLLLDE